MNWFWKVRLYRPDGFYWYSQIKTGRKLREIDHIQDFYKALTGCKMLTEGMSDVPFKNIDEIGVAFAELWSTKS